MYDIIGDVHGQADMLIGLLKRMGYSLNRNGVYFHADRKAIFVGDFINRGSKIRDTIKIIRSMVEEGYAMSVLGNHEINAIYYSIFDKKSRSLSKRLSRLRLDLDATLKEFSEKPDEWDSHIQWMRRLPMFLELDRIRVVHACWKDEHISLLKANMLEDKLKRNFLKQVDKGNCDLSTAFWETVKGVDFHMPKDLLVYDNAGRAHRSFRSKWWLNPQGLTFRELSFESRFELPDYTIPSEIVRKVDPYSASAPLVFFGHYCLRKATNIISNNLCCLDSCVSHKGKLLAYRWNGENSLVEENLFK